MAQPLVIFEEPRDANPPDEMSGGFLFCRIAVARRGTAGFFFRHRRSDFNSPCAFDQFENYCVFAFGDVENTN
jgi:hypothetical protein